MTRSVLLLGILVTACSLQAGGATNPVEAPPGNGASTIAPSTTSPAPIPTTTAPERGTSTATTTPATTTTLEPGLVRPDWLGARSLPLRTDGFGEIMPTPPELENRRLPTVDILPPPSKAEFDWSIQEVPADIVSRSTWSPGCPVTIDQLRYVTLSFVGFDGERHTGELLVNADAAEDMVEVFRRLYRQRYPMEEVRITRADELEAPPTGDGNVTGSFSCRPATGSENWSMHAYGLAIDVNPFQNPYVKADLVLPELASAYRDRDHVRAGMILPGDAVVEAFAAVGWEWGGDWSTLKDWMHFSSNGR